MDLLSTHDLTAYYGDFQAHFGTDANVNESETVAIIDSNGAGESTYLRSITELIRAPCENALFDGGPIGGLAVTAIAKLGLSLIPEGRRLFPSLTVSDIYNALPAIKASGITTVLVEQDIVRGLQAADPLYCFQGGRMSLSGRPSTVTREQIHGAYFGT